MNCNECTEINPIQTCSDSWIVGAVDASYQGTELTYQLTDLATKRMDQGLTEPVDVSGEVTIAHEWDLMSHRYHLQLFESGSSTAIEITIGTESACCILFEAYQGATSDITFNVEPCSI